MRKRKQMRALMGLGFMVLLLAACAGHSDRESNAQPAKEQETPELSLESEEAPKTEPVDETTFCQRVDRYMTGDVTGYVPKLRADVTSIN